MSEICWGKACNNVAGKQCTICGTAKYCGRDCQVNHWKEHKKECSRLKLKKAIEIVSARHSFPRAASGGRGPFPPREPTKTHCTGCNGKFTESFPCDRTCPDCRYTVCDDCACSHSRGSCFCEKKNFGYFYCDRVPKPYHISSRSNIRYSGDRHPENWWDINAKKRPEFFESEPRVCGTCGEVKKCMKKEYLTFDFPDF